MWINPSEKILVISFGKLKKKQSNKIILCCGKMPVKKKSYREHIDVIIDSFFKAGVINI
jgi:hypothetical protein